MSFLHHESFKLSQKHRIAFSCILFQKSRKRQGPIPGGSVPLGLKYKWQPIKGAFNAQSEKSQKFITNRFFFSLHSITNQNRKIIENHQEQNPRKFSRTEIHHSSQ
ncbi:hypothetical protein MTR_6g078795 [Medicago truncatula]|uniref:Uncharacterized protein n=1 Tax=Medicago truncatula TaxID=3880 RepID=A0A072UM47_MEDTR|nr:hypothetical protein MTR_6g078795 [Medicago truncatula]